MTSSNASARAQRLAQIRNVWQLRETEDLLEIWQTNDRTTWTPEALEVIGQLLAERLGTLPPQVVDPLALANKHLAQAQAHEARGELDQALAQCEAALRLAPDFAAAHHYRGLLWDSQGQLAKAIAAYQEALRLDPNLAEAQADLAAAQAEWEAQATTDAEEEAVEVFEALDDLPPDLYLSEAALIVRGWPGNRTRPNRSGYDPLDTDFENAHVTGLLLRQLFTGTLQIHNPGLLPFAALFGLLAVLPLIFSAAEFLSGRPLRLGMLGVLSMYWLPGLALLWNVARNVWQLFAPSAAPELADEQTE